MERRDGGAGDPRLGRIMLKYRPIAPKPAAPGAPVSPPETGGKRKGPARDGRRGRKARRSVTQKKVDSEVVTLPLMPMTPERKEVAQIQHDTQSPTSSSEAHVKRSEILLTESSVTVEGVTETETEGWVCSDEMVRSVMEGDGCPCFVSDAWGRVKWMNTAYRRMVMEEEEEEDVEVRVALATRGRIPAFGACKAFSCRVSVRYAACGKRGWVTLAAPCDVMFLSDGGLAWRVDLKAALSLSLGR